METIQMTEPRLALQGRKKFAKYVSLNILAMLGSSCYVVVDTFFVANGVGADGLAALNLAISLFSYMQALGLLIGIGSGTRYGVSMSRGEKEKGSQVFTTALITALSVGMIIFLLGTFFCRQIAQIVGADASILDMTAIYIKTVFSFAPFYMVNHLLVAFIRNDENPKLATAALLISNGCNVVLDYVFIYLCDWSMFGAAFATGLSPVISIGILSFHFWKKKNRFHPVRIGFSLRVVGDFCRLGVSSMVNELSFGMVIMIFNFLFLGLGGNTAVAAYGVVANVALFAVAIFTGVAQGVQPLVSDYYGRGILSQMKIIRKDTILTTVALSLILVTAAFLFSHGIVALFNQNRDPALQAIAEEGLKIYFFGFLFAGVNIAMTGYLSAMEKAEQGFVISLLRGLLIIGPAAFILSRILGMTGIWLSVPLTEFLTFAVTVIMIKKTGSKQNQI